MPRSGGFQGVVTGRVHKAAARFRFQVWAGGQQSLKRGSPGLGEEGGRAGKTQPRACAPCCFPGRVPPPTHAKPWQTAPLRTLWFLGGAKAPCGEAAAGIPPA